MVASELNSTMHGIVGIAFLLNKDVGLFNLCKGSLCSQVLSVCGQVKAAVFYQATCSPMGLLTAKPLYVMSIANRWGH